MNFTAPPGNRDLLLVGENSSETYCLLQVPKSCPRLETATTQKTTVCNSGNWLQTHLKSDVSPLEDPF